MSELLGNIELPGSLAERLAGYAAERDTLGMSGAAVYRLVAAGRPALFLKRASGPAARDLAGEAARIEWAAGRIPAPELLAFEERGDEALLLMGAVPGRDATHESYARDVPALVRALGAALRELHAAPIDGCPFDHRLEAQLAGVRASAAAGRVSADALADLAARAAAHRETPVLTHGDACLPNIMLDGGRVSGFIDLGRLGVSDRYRDLALAARSLARNWGAQHVPLLFETYGETPDQAAIELYQRLEDAL